MFRYIADVVTKIQQYNVSKYESLFRKIINSRGLTGMEIPGVDLNKKYTMDDVDSWIQEAKYSSFYDFHSVISFGNQRIDYGKIKQQLDQVPVFGFNSRRYDINLIKNDMFAVIDVKMLDITNYVPAGTSYDKYLTTYLGGCKCDDKIRCVCGLGKGLFPYEYIKAFKVLNETNIPPKSAFDSALRGTSNNNADCERGNLCGSTMG
ncbi:hypothetical protein PC110_g11466 [Phytophthora cactorum]|uniref:Uncharacterized protein n=1 Tax=Phytophthora cactorum TaxID=29920 RepID=A0A329S5Z5_9STRA|nr:hypothetical protein PC110_g11466 [Phytophthora cactorum]